MSESRIAMAGPGDPSSVSDVAPFEKLISDLSNALVVTSNQQIDDIIQKWLECATEFLGFEAAAVCQFSPDRLSARLTHTWMAPGLPPLPTTLGNADWPWVFERLKEGKAVAFCTPDDLPVEARTDIQTYHRFGVISCLSVPVACDGVTVGAFAMGTLLRQHTWSDAITQRIRLVGELLGGALVRKRVQEDLQQRLRFEQLIGEVSANLMAASIEVLPSVIEAGLRRVAEFFGVDRCSVFEFSKDGTVLTLAHVWAAPGVPLVSQIDVYRQFPWIAGIVRLGQVLPLKGIDDLPPDASLDRRSWEAADLKSVLLVPTLTGGKPRYVLALACTRSSRVWPDRIVPRMKIVGLIFAETLERTHANREIRAACEEIRRLKEQVEAENVYLREELHGSSGHRAIVGNSEAIREVVVQAEQVASADSTVLILGETGTGKELLAHYIHDRSLRKNRPFITTNLAAMPATLVESELFGREKGAFTGALTKQVGRFEAADGGTLFLDEIGEMPVETQAKLLRVLQNSEFERLGSSRTIQVSVRVIAATNQDLAAAVRNGTFRQDLYYRLNVFPIMVPPLRNHPEDIAQLAWAFIREFEEKMGKPIARINQASMELLQAYSWPGNVRELRNVIERSMILTKGQELNVTLPEPAGISQDAGAEMRDVERRHIQRILATTGGRIRGKGGAAELLGLKPSTLYSRMKKLSIRYNA